jgi:hypothetical protein
MLSLPDTGLQFKIFSDFFLEKIPPRDLDANSQASYKF